MVRRVAVAAVVAMVEEWESGKVRIKDLRLGEDVPDEEKQLDVALDDLVKVKEVLEQWALTKKMGAVKV